MMKAAGACNKTILADVLSGAEVMDLIKSELDAATNAKLSDPESEQHNVIYKNSKVFRHLKEFLDGCQFDTEGELNKFYNENFAKDFLKCHLSYVILWGNVMTAVRDRSAPRANNGIIESSFCIKKREVRENKFTLGSFGRIKIERYVNPFTLYWLNVLMNS